MKIEEYLKLVPTKQKLSDVMLKIHRRLWGQETEKIPKPWASSAELLELAGQKYFDRKTRELRDHLGCDIESTYCEQFSGHGWRICSAGLAPTQEREYLTKSLKTKLFDDSEYRKVRTSTIFRV